MLRRARSTGIVDEECQPYLAANSPCDKCSDWASRLWRIRQYGRVRSDIEHIKRALICYGPLSTASENWGHAFVIVGYDDNMECGGNSPGCWIFRNSWGTNYGEGGYSVIPYTGGEYSDLKNYVHYVTGVQAP